MYNDDSRKQCIIYMMPVARSVPRMRLLFPRPHLLHAIALTLEPKRFDTSPRLRTHVKWVIDKCSICQLQSANKGKPPIKPIRTRRCLDQIQIDLMDFRSQADGEYKWVLQIKDTFSHYIWLYALIDKSAPSVMAVLLVWLGQNGYMSKLYVIFFTYLSFY